MSGENYKKRYKLVKAEVDREMGHTLGAWGHTKAIFGGGTYTQKRKDLIDKHWKTFENTYKARRHSFAFKSPGLKLDDHYHSELTAPHFYPGKTDKVRYVPDEDKGLFRAKLNEGRMRSLSGTRLNPGEVSSGSNDIIFVRSPSMGDLTAITEKRNVTIEGEKYKTQHSSFQQGADVISAGKLKFNSENRLTKVIGSSGHYKPDEESLYKFAEYGDQTGQFNPEGIEWTSGGQIQTKMKMSVFKRMEAVVNWAKRNPKQ